MSFRYIHDIDIIGRDSLDKFVSQHPLGSIFQTSLMYDIFKDANNYEPIIIGCTDNSGNLIGILISGIFSEKFGSLTSRSIVVGGPLISEGAPLLDFVKEYNKVIDSKAIYTRFANLVDRRTEFAELEQIGFKFKDHLNYNFDLSIGVDELWKNMHNTRRRQINRGRKRGIEVKIMKEVADLDKYYSILKLTYDNAGLPLHDFSYFKSAYDILKRKNNIIFFSAYNGSKLIGFRIVLSYKKTLYDWFAGDLPEERDKYTNDVLVWEVLKWGAEQNYNLFDFGGAGDPDKEYGVRDFKKKFGGNEVNFGNYLIVHNKVKYNLVQKLVPIYKMLNKK